LPYPQHKKGCPNYGKGKLCPPNSPAFTIENLKQYKTLVLMYADFNFRAYKEKMRASHPDWSEKQLGCCLYWQKPVKILLKNHLETLKDKPDFILGCGSGFVECYSMESVGLNVIDMLYKLDIDFEVKPVNKVVLCTMLGYNSEVKINE
jgi:predicted metal-binding protein